MKAIVWFSRVFTGVLFIISGLIKANDPTGFSYKLEEYFGVFGIEWMNDSALALSIFICAFEIVLGTALLLGAFKKATLWGLLLLIVFFTFLTFYSAYFNVVTDCGCFGDAVKLTPWQSFSKDIILLVLILILFIRKNDIQSLLTERAASLSVLAAFLLSLGFGVYCVRHLPVIDFLPYKIGNNIPEQMKIPPGEKPDEYQIMYTLAKKGTGEIKEVNDKEYISSGIWEDSTWEYKSASEPVLVKKGYQPKIKDLRLSDADGNEYTDDIIKNPAYTLLIVSNFINKTNAKSHEELSKLTVELEKLNVKVVGLTSSSSAETEAFRHEVNAIYPFYYGDATALKSIIRANPGIVLLHNGIVVNKWHYNDLPDLEELKEQLQSK